MGRRERLLQQLASHVPGDRQEHWSLKRTIALVRWLPAPFDEQADPTHVTASAIVVDGDRVVLHRHKRLGVWLQPGGHIDADERPEDAVLREVAEETGLEAAHPPSGPQLVHVDVHEGGRGHLHLDLRYRLDAHATRFAPATGESSELGWFGVDEALALCDRSAGAAIMAALTVR